MGGEGGRADKVKEGVRSGGTLPRVTLYSGSNSLHHRTTEYHALSDEWTGACKAWKRKLK